MSIIIDVPLMLLVVVAVLAVGVGMVIADIHRTDFVRWNLDRRARKAARKLRRMK